MIEHIVHQSKLFAIVIRAQYQKDGIEFFTPHNFSQQIAYMKRSKGYSIEPHIHNIVRREVQFTQEVLFIKNGKVRVDFFDDNQTFLESRILEQGDVILLAHGGHGLEMLEESEIIEVKQGPYAGEADKVKFAPLSSGKSTSKETDK